jgi:hypothetical protein
MTDLDGGSKDETLVLYGLPKKSGDGQAWAMWPL